MSSSRPEPVPEPTPRRIALVDLTPGEFRLLPELLRRPGLRVELLALPPEGTPGAGEVVSDIPLTRDLADLARRPVDLVLIGASCARRSEVERLVAARAIPLQQLEDFLASEIVWDRIDALHRPVRGGARPVPAPDRPAPQERPARAPAPAGGTQEEPLEEMPLPGDPAAIERALARWVERHEAVGAELHGGEAEHVEWVCRAGAEDPLLRCIVSLALEHDAPQVVSLLDGFRRGRLYAAWPFRAGFRRGVLAAGGLDPHHGRARWERLATALAAAWERHDRERAGPAFPMLPGAGGGWLSPAAFRHRLSLAVERNRRDGLRFEAQRMVLHGPPECVEALARVLPRKLRDTDCACRSAPGSLLLLVAGPAASVAQVRRRIATVWQEAWQVHAGAGPAPPPAVERVELATPGDAAAFEAAAATWLAAA